MRYSEFSIEMLLERLLTRSMADKTPQKYSTVMFEAWEVIRQLQQDLAAAQQKANALDLSVQNTPIQCPRCGQPYIRLDDHPMQNQSRR